MDKNEKIEVTREQFNEAIKQEAMSIFESPENIAKPEATLLLVMGGTAFAKGVMGRLFNKEEKSDE